MDTCTRVVNCTRFTWTSYTAALAWWSHRMRHQRISLALMVQVSVLAAPFDRRRPLCNDPLPPPLPHLRCTRDDRQYSHIKACWHIRHGNVRWCSITATDVELDRWRHTLPCGMRMGLYAIILTVTTHYDVEWSRTGPNRASPNF